MVAETTNIPTIHFRFEGREQPGDDRHLREGGPWNPRHRLDIPILLYMEGRDEPVYRWFFPSDFQMSRCRSLHDLIFNAFLAEMDPAEISDDQTVRDTLITLRDERLGEVDRDQRTVLFREWQPRVSHDTFVVTDAAPHNAIRRRMLDERAANLADAEAARSQHQRLREQHADLLTEVTEQALDGQYVKPELVQRLRELGLMDGTTPFRESAFGEESSIRAGTSSHGDTEGWILGFRGDQLIMIGSEPVIGYQLPERP
jgi:hypothetical protein